jgi:hypothetical protein
MLTVMAVIDRAVSILAMNRKLCCCQYDSLYFGHCPLGLQKIFRYYGKLGGRPGSQAKKNLSEKIPALIIP